MGRLGRWEFLGREQRKQKSKGGTYWLMALPGTKAWKWDKSKDTHQPGRKLEGPKKWHCWLTWGCWWGAVEEGGMCFGTSLTLFLTSLWPLNSR